MFLNVNVFIGVTGEDVEREVHDYIVRSGAYPSPLGFHNYPKSLVVSLNEGTYV